MGWKLREKITKLEFFCYPFLLQTFYILCFTPLSLLLPISFLVLARLSHANYLLSLASINPPKTFIFNIFLHTNPNILHALILVVALSSLIHALTGRIGISLKTNFPGPIFRPRVYATWIFICTLQVCVGLGVKATTITAGVNEAEFGGGRSSSSSMIISKLFFFVGLHETMIHWSRTIVRPIVDDTVYGEPRKERWPEKWVLTVCFGILSWWRLRYEVDSLVVLVEVRRDMMMKVGLGDFVGLSLYYLTVVIGMSRILKVVIICFFMRFFCKRIVDDGQDSYHQLDDKV